MCTTFKSPVKARTTGLADNMDGIAHLSVPGFDIWCLNDGDYVFDPEDFSSVRTDVLDRRLTAAHQNQIDTVFHAFLIKPTGGDYALFDTGCGTAFGDIAGQLMRRFSVLDVKPSDIKTLIFSHLHSDHAGGAVVKDQPAFPNAEVFMHDDEPSVWAGGDFAGNAVLDCYQNSIQTVGDAAEILPGVKTWALPGHTAGHMGLRIGLDVVLCADILHSDALQLPDPTVASVHDEDPERARTTRLAALREIADSGVIFAGSHGCRSAKFRRLTSSGSGYVGVPL